MMDGMLDISDKIERLDSSIQGFYCLLPSRYKFAIVLAPSMWAQGECHQSELTANPG